MMSQSSPVPCSWKKGRPSSLPPGHSRISYKSMKWKASLPLWPARCVYVYMCVCVYIAVLRYFSSNQIADLANEDTPQLYVACGRGPRSSLRVLRHGLEVCLL